MNDTQHNRGGQGGRVGKIVQVIGPVIDIAFEGEGELPPILNAVEIKESGNGNQIYVVAEIAHHLGERLVRAVAMQPTDGIVRGMAAKDRGAPISVPVGPATLGRVLNVLGEPVDTLGP